jgi:photosystem II stability/assembly factor-like uncharacterized protein
MNKLHIIFAFLLLSAPAYLCKIKKTEPRHLRIPADAPEDGRAARRQWERARFADPATGRIPAGIRFLERRFAAGLPAAVEERGNGMWTSRGPWNYGGRTRALALDATNEKRVLAGGVSGGLWLSEDGGQSWTRRTPPDAHPGCVSIAQDTRPGKTDTWYYLSGEIFGASASASGAFYLGDGVFKSTDKGLTWKPLISTAAGNQNAFTSDFQTGWRIVTDPSAPPNREILYMATYASIYRSVDGGQSWTAVLGGGTGADISYYTDVAITSKGVLYATLSSNGPKKGIWRSADGIAWKNITPADFPNVYDRITLGINPNNEDEVWFLAATPGSGQFNRFIDEDDWNSLWKYAFTGDAGLPTGGIWENRSANLPASGTPFDKFTSQGGYDLVVKVQPGTNHVFIGGTNLYRSTDGFKTPAQTTQIGGYKRGTELPFFELYPNHHPDLHEVVFLPSDPKVLFTASDGGLHRTNDCGAQQVGWTSLNRGYGTTQFYTAMIEHTLPGDATLIGGLQDNGNLFVNSTAPEAPWVQTVNGDGAFGAILDGKKGYVLSIHQGRLVKCGIDAQGTITAFQRFDPIWRKKEDYLFINPLALDPADQNVLYYPAGRRLYRQNDLSAIPLKNEWDSIAQGWTQFPDTVSGDAGVISALAVSKANPANRLYFGTSRNKLYRIDNAREGAPSTTALTTPPVPVQAYINCIAVDPANADRVLVAYSNYNVYSLFLSTNGGQNWSRVGGNLERNTAGSGNAPSLRWIGILPQAGGKRKYFCATSAGLYSADTLLTHTASQPGTQWTLEGPNTLGQAVVNYVEVRPVDGLVVAATHGIGMFSANFTNSVPLAEPASGASARVFPNPASGNLFVDFEMPGLSATFCLFDLSGRAIRRTTLSNGRNKVDVSGLRPGVYFYEMKGNTWRKGGTTVVL